MFLVIPEAERKNKKIIFKLHFILHCTENKEGDLKKMTPTHENKYKLLNIIPMCFQKTSPKFSIYVESYCVFLCYG